MVKLSFIYLLVVFVIFGFHSVKADKVGGESQNFVLAQEGEGEGFDDGEQYEEPEDDLYEEEDDQEEYDDLDDEETEEELEEPYYPEEPVEEEAFEEESQI